MPTRSATPRRGTRVLLRGALAIACAAGVALTAACGSQADGGGDSPAAIASTAAPTADAPTADAPTADAPATATSPAEAPAAAASDVTITIEGFAYDLPDSVPAGSTVLVVNKDTEAHTVTAADGSFDVTVAGGATESFIARAGTYEFACTFHGNMTGTLVVD